MQCDICFRTGGHRLPFLCPTDARNQLYDPRIQNARVLVEKDALDREITMLIASRPDNDEHDPRKAEIDRTDVSRVLAGKDQAVNRTQQIIAHADELRMKVEKAREDIAKRKAVISRRKSELATASNGVEARRARQMEEVEKSIRMTKYKWNQTHSVTASSRAFLCGEAAKLYGLRRVRRNGGLEEYRIGGITIMDLRSLNTASPAQISTALSHIVHLLMLWSTPGHSSNNSPTASRTITDPPDHPRPRPLFISKPLPMLATEDPAGYGLFLEAVTLLTYDITWLCKSQGVPVGENSTLEEVCNIGKNLFDLLIGSQPRPSPGSRVPSTQSTPTKGNVRAAESEAEDKKAPSSIMGRFSHGTAHSFLGNADGTDFMRSWKLLTPMKLADRLKSKLLSEVANAEWEVLDQDAWAVDDEMRDDGVVVGPRKEEGGVGLGMQSFMSMKTVIDAARDVLPGNGDRKPGTSGWTKLKPRQNGPGLGK
ncbi:Autophagy-related 14 [Hyphodiscus hymeniophilus]|uniref:Autophagy-related protein 14 n=1 Tax=Hyphodiscus hymeniophilus TaxID=353542 RepID=A0A9P6VPS4_9HELO|nr:Autophagy-related 14 [Hyphodiscus hymeniophilus]